MWAVVDVVEAPLYDIAHMCILYHYGTHSETHTSVLHGDRQDPNDTELKIRVDACRSINVQTTSTKLAGNVPDLPLTFPVHHVSAAPVF